MESWASVSVLITVVFVVDSHDALDFSGNISNGSLSMSIASIDKNKNGTQTRAGALFASARPPTKFLSQPQKDSCKSDTGGTCSVFNCSYWRGPAECSGLSRRCTCKPGYCARNGVCTLQLSEFRAKVAPVNQEKRLFPGAHGHVAKAVCFSGGGSRSQTLVMGQLRALEDIKVMTSVDAVSSVSGGTWASSVYMFANRTLSDLLGAPTVPSQLSPEILTQTPPELGATATTDWFLEARKLFLQGTPWDKIWQYMVGIALLKPFDLDALDAFMAPDSDTARRIQAENPQLKKSRFVVPQVGRPKTFVMNGAVLPPTPYPGKVSSDGSNIVSLQMSPDFTGSPFYPNGSEIVYDSEVKPSHRIVGGGFIETFAFGGSAPVEPWQDGDIAKVKSPALPFSLVDAVGISSAAPGFESYRYSPTIADWVDPRAQYWPIPSKQFPTVAPAMTYEMGDGGDLENSGLLAMLQRGAKKIGWFVNSETPLKIPTDVCTPPIRLTSTFDPNGMISEQVYDKFGFGYAAKESNRVNQFIEHNQVFASDQLIPLLCALQKLIDQGKPAVHKMTQEVLQNTWWGIEGEYKVELVLVYNNKCTNFEASLPDDTQELIRKGEFDFRKGKFPHYGTFAGSLTARQVNLLAAQAEYAVRQNAQLFQELFA